MSELSSNDQSTTTDIFASDPSQQAPAPTPKQRKARGNSFLRDNALLLAMPVIAAGVLYALSLRGGPAAASAQQLQNELQVESAISSLTAKTSDVNKVKTQGILDNFYHEAKQRQIPLERLQGNPFVFKAPSGGNPKTAATKPVEIVPVAPPVDNDLTAAMNAVKQMHLQSILSGSSGRAIATISNNLLTEGQTISGWTVGKIAPTEVTLTWRDQTYVLKMKE
jgi:hypothetical protein